MPSTQHVDNEFSNRFFADVFQLDPQFMLIWDKASIARLKEFWGGIYS
jgi:hypothetical protein